MKKTIRIIILFFICIMLFSACNGQSEPYPPESSEVSSELSSNDSDSDSDSGLERFQRFSLEHFDTVISITGYANSQDEFDEFSQLIFSEFREMHRLFDIYNVFPELNNIRTINESAGLMPVEVSPVLIELIERSIEAYHLTNGAVNIALGPVLEVWSAYSRTYPPAVPSTDLLRAANAYTNIDDVIVDTEKNTVFLRYSNMSLDVGGLAKGFAMERVVHIAREAGFLYFLINMGGDVFAADLPPERESWNVGVEYPGRDASIVDVVSVSNLAVFSSGNYLRYFEVDGVAYGHLIDPHSLMPARNFRSVAVLHPSAMYAEILSTAIFILDQDAGIKLLKALNADGVWVGYDDLILTTPDYSKFSMNF